MSLWLKRTNKICFKYMNYSFFVNDLVYKELITLSKEWKEKFKMKINKRKIISFLENIL